MLGDIYIGEPRDVYIGKVDANGDPVLTEGGLTVRNTGAAVNDATVTATLKDSAGTTIGSAATLSYVATSNGHYLGTLTAATTALLTAGTQYAVWVTSSTGSVYRKLLYKAGYRGVE